MWKECIDALLSCTRNSEDGSTENDSSPQGLVFIDGTLGGGGHSEALLQRLSPGDVVFGVDVDPAALATASERLVEYLPVLDDDNNENNNNNQERPLFVPVQSNFGNLVATLSKTLHPLTQQPMHASSIDGILLDLGVSSHQIDTAARGFAFMQEGPLDMRLGGANGPLTAAEICNEFDARDLKRIFKTYGDEPRARSIAASILNHRPLKTTADLVEAVAAVVPQFAKKGRRMGRTATLARVFQSLRIVVNQEDVVLEQALTQMAPTLLRPGGRLVVLSYHSLEDRAAKRVMRDGTLSAKRNDERDMYGNYNGTPRPFLTLGKPQKATDEEVEQNGRARSATLRVAERQES
jgi:16S rRNA (cytosine1402-N4)-methyltransferase